MQKSKLKSIKTWIVVFCMALLSYIVVTSKTDFIDIAKILATALVAYLPVNVWQKKVCSIGDESNGKQ